MSFQQMANKNLLINYVDPHAYTTSIFSHWAISPGFLKYHFKWRILKIPLSKLGTVQKYPLLFIQSQHNKPRVKSNRDKDGKDQRHFHKRHTYIKTLKKKKPY